MDNVTNNIVITPAINDLSQENQDYYNWRDQQYIAYKYDDGLEQVTLELVPVIILEKIVFTCGLTIMINGIIPPTHM